jgi:hypothetical protein
MGAAADGLRCRTRAGCRAAGCAAGWNAAVPDPAPPQARCHPAGEQPAAGHTCKGARVLSSTSSSPPSKSVFVLQIVLAKIPDVRRQPATAKPDLECACAFIAAMRTLQVGQDAERVGDMSDVYVPTSC